MIHIKREALDEALTARLIELSRCWAEEGCSHGIVANEAEDLHAPLWIARDGETVVGYAFGHCYTAERKTGYVLPGSRCFELEELYVHPQRRSEGIGRALYQAVRTDIREEADYLTLATSTKDWQRILSFYTEELGMDFHSAFLMQSLSDCSDSV